MTDNKNSSKLVAIAAVIGLIAFSFILIFSLNFFSWPIGSLLSEQQGTQAVLTSTVQPGMLVVTTQGIREMAYSGPTLNQTANLLANRTNGPLPIGNSSLSILRSGSSAKPLIIETDPETGQFSMYLSPANYLVRFLDGRFGNLSVTVQISEATTTSLTAVVNESDYAAESFNLVDSDSSGWFGGWQQIYALITANNSLASGSGVSTFVGVSNALYQYSSCTDCLPLPTNTSNLVPASIIGSSHSINSQWLEIHLTQLTRIDGVTGLTVITQQVSYTVKSIVS
ncbi:MAG: hypothetical protein ACYC7D_11800 [Nitrososphaerales archaeon]